jgi:hypothetical protein
MAWLGGTVQRWIVLVGLVATALGIVSFAVSEHLPWAWLAIGALLLLVVSLGSELWKVQRPELGPDQAALDRAIADGRALLRYISPQHGIVSQSVLNQWTHWRDGTFAMLRQHYGLATAQDFQAAGTGGNHPGHWVAKQVEFLENLN